MPADEMTFTLTRDEFDRLLIMAGYATGAAMKNNPRLAHDFFDLANQINKNNPRWRPYVIPEEYKAATPVNPDEVNL